MTKVVTTTRTIISKPVQKDDPPPLPRHPLSRPPIVQPSSSLAKDEPSPPKKRKRAPSVDQDAKPPSSKAKAPTKKRTTSAAPKEKRVQRLREETPTSDAVVRNRSRTRERNLPSSRMGALEATIPQERWWRGSKTVPEVPLEVDELVAPEADSNPDPDVDVVGVPTIQHVHSVDIVRPKWRGYRACEFTSDCRLVLLMLIPIGRV